MPNTSYKLEAEPRTQLFKRGTGFVVEISLTIGVWFQSTGWGSDLSPKFDPWHLWPCIQTQMIGSNKPVPSHAQKTDMIIKHPPNAPFKHTLDFKCHESSVEGRDIGKLVYPNKRRMNKRAGIGTVPRPTVPPLPEF